MIEIKNLKFLLDRKYYNYNGSHIWFTETDGKVRIGMDPFLTEQAGYLNYLTIDNKEFKQGEAIGSFESAKFVSKFYSPVSGKITSVNEDVVNDPISINNDPFNAWIVEIQPNDLENDLKSDNVLDDENNIKTWIENELERLEQDAAE